MFLEHAYSGSMLSALQSSILVKMSVYRWVCELFVYEICDDGLCHSQNKRLWDYWTFFYYDQSLLFAFVHNSIQRNRIKTCDDIMKATYAAHVIGFCIALGWSVDILILIVNSTKQ